MKVLKTYGYWMLTKSTDLRYFKNGRANMHVRTTYSISFDNAKYYADHGVDLECETGSFWIKTKAEALKEFSQLKKNHLIGGAELRSDLFPAKGA